MARVKGATVHGSAKALLTRFERPDAANCLPRKRTALPPPRSVVTAFADVWPPYAVSQRGARRGLAPCDQAARSVAAPWR